MPGELVGSARVTIEPDVSGFEKALANGVKAAGRAIGGITADITKATGRALGGVASTITKSFASAATFIGRNLVGAAKVATSATAAIGAAAVVSGVAYNRLGQRVTAALTTMLGTRDAARKMIKEVTAFARSSPFPRQAFLAATQQLLGFGEKAQNIIPILKAIENAVAAIGGSAEDIAEITDVFARIRGQGKITGEELNRLGIRGINAAELIGKAMGKTGAQIREAITAGSIDADTAIGALVKGMNERFAGAADNVKKSFEGALDRVKGVIRDIGSALVSGFIGFESGGALAEGFNAIADGLRKLEAHLGPVQTLLDQLAKRVGDAMKRVGKAIGELNLGKIENLRTILQGLGPLAAAAGAAIAVAFSSSLPVIGGLLGGINPLFAALVALVATAPELRKAFVDTFTAIKPELQQAGVALLSVLRDTFTAIKPLLATVLQAAGAGLSIFAHDLVVVLQATLPALQAVFETLGDALRAIGPSVKDIVSAFSSGLAILLPELARAFDALLQAVLPLIPVLDKALFAALQAIVPAVTTLVTSFAGAAADVLPKVVGLFAQLLTAVVPLATVLLDFGGRVLSALAQSLGTVIDALAETLGSVLPPLTLAFSRVLDVLEPILAQLASAFSTVLVAILQALVPVIVTLAQAITNFWTAAGPVFAQFVAMLGSFLAQAITAVAPLLTAVAEAFGTILQSLTPLLPVLLQAAQVVGQAFLQALITVTPALVTLAQAVADFVAAAGPALASVAAVLGQVFAQAIITLAPLLVIIAQAFASILTQLQPLFPVLAQVVAKLGEAFLNALIDLTPSLIDLTKAFTDLLVALVPLVPPILQLVEAVLPLVPLIVKLATVGMKQWIQSSTDLARVLRPVVEFLGRTSRLVSNLAEIGMNALATGIGWVIDKLKGLWNWFDKLIKKVKDFPVIGRALKLILPGSLPPLALGAFESAKGIEALSKRFTEMNRQLVRAGSQLKVPNLVLPTLETGQTLRRPIGSTRGGQAAATPVVIPQRSETHFHIAQVRVPSARETVEFLKRKAELEALKGRR